MDGFTHRPVFRFDPASCFIGRDKAASLRPLSRLPAWSALVGIIFFRVAFATLELAYVEYHLNTLEEVTRRAATVAANVDFRDAAALQKVQANAVFRNSPGWLALGTPVTCDSIKIDYLWLSKAGWDLKHMNTLSSCPVANRSNCMTNAHADNRIRLVRAWAGTSVDGDGNCERLR